MPQVLPFSAWRYNQNLVKIEDVVAPPYDVVTEEEISYFKKKSPYNIFHLELPESYQKAKELLNEWIKSSVIVNTEAPAVYLYELEFEFLGRKYLRKGFVALVELSDFNQGKIVPHEKVFAKVTEDRFNLLKATGFQFSQIFGLYEDENLKLFSFKPQKRILYQVRLNDQVHTLYEIKDKKFLKLFSEFFKDKRIFIADGHHRYTTALKYKEYMQEKFGSETLKDFNFTAMYLCAIEDPNLLMLPTHRVYKTQAEEFIKAFEKFVEVKKELSQEEAFQKELLESEWMFVTQDKCILVKIKKEVFEEIKARDPLLAKLPVYNFLEVFKKVFSFGEEELKEKGKVSFISDVKEVLDTVKKERGIGVIFPGVSPKVLKEVALAGKRMPHKSTYFYPKILTGMLLNEVSGKDLRVF